MAKAWEIIGLVDNQPLKECARLIIITKFREAFSYQDLVRTSEDIEVIHNMRVSLRRLWAAMTSFSHYFNQKKFFRLSQKTRTLAGKLGKVRDLDVLIELLEKHSKYLEEKPSTTLTIGYLVSQWQSERLKHRGKLFKYLEKLANKEFERKFLTFFDSITQNKCKETKETKKTKKTKNEKKIFLNTLKNFYRHAPKENFSSESLHQLRIAAKKLRYSLEFYEICFNQLLTNYLKTLKEIQELLGDLHDCDVMIDLLKKYLKKITIPLQQELYLGLTELSNYFSERRANLLNQFQKLWDIEFESNFRIELKSALFPVSNATE